MPKIVQEFEFFIDPPNGRQILQGVLEVYYVLEFADEGIADKKLSRWVLTSASINGLPVENLDKPSAWYEEQFLWTAESFLP